MPGWGDLGNNRNIIVHTGITPPAALRRHAPKGEVLTSEIGDHGIEYQHSRRRAAQAGIADALYETVFQ
ncbi:hypothetical protein thsrh120_14210 [Rhizobium sp. No.120]